MSSPSISEKRIHSELTMLEKLPDGYNIAHQNFDGGLKIYLEIDKKLIDSELKPDTVNTYRFTILLAQDFPFGGPRVQCNTNFTQTSMSDQRDLFVDIVGSEWIASNTLYEICKLIPEFVTEVLVKEVSGDQKFIGRFLLGSRYYIEDYFGYFDVWKFHDINNMFSANDQPLPDGEVENSLRYLIVSDTALMICEPTLENKRIAL